MTTDSMTITEQVARLLVEGQSRMEIAVSLGITRCAVARTCRAHRQRAGTRDGECTDFENAQKYLAIPAKPHGSVPHERLVAYAKAVLEGVDASGLAQRFKASTGYLLRTRYQTSSIYKAAELCLVEAGIPIPR